MIQVHPWHQLELSCEMKLACHDQTRWIHKCFATLTFYNLGIHGSTLIYRLTEAHIEYFFFYNCRCITSVDVVMEQTLSLSLNIINFNLLYIIRLLLFSFCLQRHIWPVPYLLPPAAVKSDLYKIQSVMTPFAPVSSYWTEMLYPQLIHSQGSFPNGFLQLHLVWGWLSPHPLSVGLTGVQDWGEVESPQVGNQWSKGTAILY